MDDADCKTPPTGAPDRRAAIIGAAYELLVERGYHGTSTLAIAKRARVSKATIYELFGSKEGLFRALIGGRSARMNAELMEDLGREGQPVEAVLTRLGVNLLSLLLSDQAVAVNRAAIAEAHTHPELARILAERGRGETSSLVAAYLQRKVADGTLVIGDTQRAMDVLYGMLVGGLQWNRLANLMPVPPQEHLEQRAREAAALFLRLYAAPR